MTTQERMVRCFSNVFPDLPEDQVPQATMETVADWDSVAHVTLISSLAEEFEQPFELEDFEEMVSFQKAMERVEAKLAKPPAS